MPAEPVTAIGRNVKLFAWAVKEAYRPAATWRATVAQRGRRRLLGRVGGQRPA